jgi:hypothetical protein
MFLCIDNKLYYFLDFSLHRPIFKMKQKVSKKLGNFKYRWLYITQKQIQ